ncbi:hypothetical protein Hanom_Chr07g00581181 [Helianthus anomalus]
MGATILRAVVFWNMKQPWFGGVSCDCEHGFLSGKKKLCDAYIRFLLTSRNRLVCHLLNVLCLPCHLFQIRIQVCLLFQICCQVRQIRIQVYLLFQICCQVRHLFLVLQESLRQVQHLRSLCPQSY